MAGPGVIALGRIRIGRRGTTRRLKPEDPFTPGEVFRAALRAALVLPIALLARAISPFKVIRFRKHYSARIGHFGVEPEVFLCEKDAGVHGPPGRFLDLFFYDRGERTCNQQIKKMWDRTLHTLPFSLYPIESVLRRVPGGRVHIVPWPSERDVHGLFDTTPSHLQFTAAESEVGAHALEGLGVPRGAPFVCFHARDPVYQGQIDPDVDLRYQDHRDFDIQTYHLALDALTARGYYAIRMGVIVKDPLRTNNPRVIDYPRSNQRSDFLDIFLAATCDFFLASGSGIDAIPMTFRRPTMFTNTTSIERGRFWEATHLFIPKKHWLPAEGRMMRFREILDTGAGRYLHTQEYEAAGIQLIDNTAEEIRDVTLEMNDRLNGRWQHTPEDDELQRRFWALFRPSSINSVFRGRLGAAFLRAHRDLLD